MGERPITSISRRDVLGLIEGIRDTGTAATLAAYGKGKKGKAEKAPAPGQARNLLGLLKTFFGWVIERGTYGLNSSPCEHLKAARIIGERQADDRTLADDELLAFWGATGELGYPYGPLYRLLLLSGLRLNEVADAVWSEFDLAKGIWTVPAARMKGTNGKARPHTVPLTAEIFQFSLACRVSIAASICSQQQAVKALSGSATRSSADLMRRCLRSCGSKPKRTAKRPAM